VTIAVNCDCPAVAKLDVPDTLTLATVGAAGGVGGAGDVGGVGAVGSALLSEQLIENIKAQTSARTDRVMPLRMQGVFPRLC
jgi:hypothetical protein